MSVSDASSQIIVSQGVVDALGPEQFEAVLRHEVAHLDHNHQRWLVLIAVIERAVAVLPPPTSEYGGAPSRPRALGRRNGGPGGRPGTGRPALRPAAG